MAFPRNPHDGDLWVEGWFQYIYEDSIPGWRETGIIGADVEFDGVSRITNLGDAVDPRDAVTLEQAETITGGGVGGIFDEIEFIHTQPIAATTWNVVHNLNQQWVAVQVVDNGGNTVVPTPVYTSANAVQLVFASPVAGRAVIRR